MKRAAGKNITVSSPVDGGFTLMEALVALGITSLMMAIVVSQVLSFKQAYFTDVVRMEINSNLRAAMDIISMNIRQAGENLQASFPAVVVENGSDGAADVLKLRRALVPEVLTLCAPVAVGALSLPVSSASLSNTRCIPGNIDETYEVFEQWRAANDGTMRIYLYDRSRDIGEFVNYTGGSISDGQYALTITGLTNIFPGLATSIYIVEEYSFELNTADNVLDVYIDGDRIRRTGSRLFNFQLRYRTRNGGRRRIALVGARRRLTHLEGYQEHSSCARRRGDLPRSDAKIVGRL